MSRNHGLGNVAPSVGLGPATWWRYRLYLGLLLAPRRVVDYAAELPTTWKDWQIKLELGGDHEIA